MTKHSPMGKIRAGWSHVAEEAQGNPSVTVPFPRKWTPTLEKCLLKIDEYLEGDWDSLVKAVRYAHTGGAERRLILSANRLSSNDCSRLEELVGGCWESPERVQIEADLAKKEAGAIEDAKVRAALDKLKGEACQTKPKKDSPSTFVRPNLSKFLGN